MLQPKRQKYRRPQKGKMKGNAFRGHQLAFGSFGIKVWICKGEIYGKPELVPTSVAAPAKKQGSPRPAGRGPRRGEGKRK